MRRRVAFISTYTALLLLLSAGAVFGQDVPLGPTTRHRMTFEVTNPPGPAPLELAQLILEFAPGAFTPPHTHGGPPPA